MEILHYFPQSDGDGGIILGAVLSHVDILSLGMDLATLGQSTGRREEPSSPMGSQRWHPVGEKVPSIWDSYGSGQHLVGVGVQCVH